jgi:hypothetical protein
MACGRRSVLAPRRSADHSRRVPETLNPARRWNSFVCPGCRFVFRVPQDHDGKGVVCPACRIMLRLPGADDFVPPLLSAARAENADELEEIEAEADDDAATSGGDWKFLLSLAVPALVLLGLFAWWMAPGPGETPVTTQIPVEPSGKASTGGVEIEPAAKSMLVEIESVLKAFLSATTAAEILQQVKDPENTAAKLRSWLEDRDYRAPGFREMLGDSVATTAGGDLMTVTVRTDDFELRQVVLLETAGGFKVDWESWVGWSEIPWDEFMEERPEEGKWFRVELSQIEYYNFGFTDEDQWVSYRLDSPDGNLSIYGYVPRGSELDGKIRPFEENTKSKLLLKLKYPADGRADNQVLIEAVSGHEWVELPGADGP